MSNTLSHDDHQNEHNLRADISRILGIENSAAWEIVSSDPDHNLYMVHHKLEANLSDYGQIRGIVVDTRAGCIVCRSYGYSPTVVSNQLTLRSDDGNIHLTDELGQEHVLNPARSLFKIGFEGTMINVFKHDGIVYRSTRKRLDASKSRWGTSQTFLDMYWQLGGPSDEELFDIYSSYSPYCHTFIIVHPEVLVVSKDNVGDGYLVYLGPKQMWSTDYHTCPYKQLTGKGDYFDGVTEEQFNQDLRINAGWIDDTLHLPTTIPNLSDNVSYDQGVIFSSKNISFEEANKHLLFGFYNEFPGYEALDKRMLPGEFVIVQKLDENGALSGMLRVESIAYNWRAGMRDNNPNLLHRFFQLVNGSYLRADNTGDRERYQRLYPSFTPYGAASIKKQLEEEGPYVVWPQAADSVELQTKEELMYNIWLAFLNTVPLHSQKEVSTYLDYLYAKRGELIRWLRGLETQGHIDPSLFSPRVLNILEVTRGSAQRMAKEGRDRDATGKRLSLKAITNNNIKNLIMKEEGSSLYRLVREMDQYKTLVPE